MAREIQVLVPDIGDFDEVEVVEVLVAKGDRVSVEDSLVSLESDKATMEIPSPEAGIVSEVRVQLGHLVSEGSLLILLEVDEAAAGAEPPAETSQATPPGQEQEQLSQEQQERPDPIPPEREEVPPAPVSPAAEPTAVASPAPPVPQPTESRPGSAATSHASPLVRKVAREWGVDIEKVGAPKGGEKGAGSGPHGRILVDDLKKHVGQHLAAPQEGTGIPAVRTVDFSRFGEVEQKPLSRMRQRAGQNLSRSWLNLPHVTQHDEADITRLEEFRKSPAVRAQAEASGVKLSPLVFVMKAVVQGLRRFPEVGSSLSPDGKSLILKDSIHMGIAVDTDDGLVVPVVRDVDRKRVIELAEETAALADTARAGKLKPDQIQGAGFTISSLGGIGGTFFTPIVNAPEVALLGVSRTFVKPVWSRGLDLSEEGGGAFVPRLILPLSLSYDHRVIDGAAAVRFTTFVKTVLEDPALLLL